MDTIRMKPVKLSEILPILRELDTFALEDAASIIEQDGMGINNSIPIALTVSGHPDSRVLVFK